MKSPAAGNRSSRPNASVDPPARGGLALSWTLLALAVGVLYLPSLGIPFIGDDYVFLEKTRLASFASLWSRANTNFGWYRPWSREFHFWALQHLAGPNPQAFRAANLLLWSASLVVFGEAIRRWSTARTALLVVAGVASLGLWGAPLLWISGSQDLWLFFFVSLSLLCIASGHDRWALVPYALALLSKETAAVFPLMAAGAWWFLGRRSAKDVAWRLAPFAALTAAWAFVHPVLAHRLLGGPLAVPGAEPSLPPAAVLAKTALSMVNADQLGQPLVPMIRSVLTTGLGGLLLAAAVWFLPGEAPRGADDAPDRLVRAGACWAAAGWLPLFLPSISWHAYYGCMGAAGAWVAFGAWARDRRRLVVAVMLAVGLLRVFNTSTRAWDWGSEWYQRRAGALLGGVQQQLLARYPALPRHTRLYFGSLPNNIGLVAGSSPAVRMWYRDSTLQAGFYSAYAPRTAADSPGPDLFFHFDSTRGLEPVQLGDEDVGLGVRNDPGWARNHESVAMVLLEAGDPARAATEYEKLGRLRSRPQALMFAAICREAAGDTARARWLLSAAGERMGQTPEQVAAWAAELRASMPMRRR